MTLSYDFALRDFTETLKWLSSLPILMNNRSEGDGTALGIVLLQPPRGISLSPFYPGNQTKSSQLIDAGSRVECPWNNNNQSAEQT